MTNLILFLQSKFDVLINTLNIDLTIYDKEYLVSFIVFIIALFIAFDFVIKYIFKIMNFLFKRPEF